jgi:hypothetical protein
MLQTPYSQSIPKRMLGGVGPKNKATASLAVEHVVCTHCANFHGPTSIELKTLQLTESSLRNPQIGCSAAQSLPQKQDK